MSAVSNSSGTDRPRLQAPANACDCHMHIYDGDRFPPARPGPQSRMQENAADRPRREPLRRDQVARDLRVPGRRSCSTTAHAALETLTLTRDQMRFKQMVSQELATLIYNGFWFSAHTQDLMSYVCSTQRFVTGTVRMKLYKEKCAVVGRKAEHSLYNEALATYGQGDLFDHAAAVGFIKVAGMAVVNQASSQLLLGAGATERMMRLAAGQPTDADAEQVEGREKVADADGGVAQRDHALRRRFTKAQAASVKAFNDSLPFDRRMAEEDIVGSIAHARMLGRQGIIPAGGRPRDRGRPGHAPRRARRARRPARRRRRRGHPQLRRAPAERDGRRGGRAAPHRALPQRPGRQRPPDVEPRRPSATASSAALALQAALLDRAERDRGPDPAGLHPPPARPAGPAQPPLAGVRRDAGPRRRPARRLLRPDGRDAARGRRAGRLAVPARPRVRGRAARLRRVSANSMDAVADRDFVVEHLSALALLAVHLSRLAEELILWSSAEFGFVEMDDAYATGSSIMPQKKNSDVAELVRGKAGAAIGTLVQMLVTLKGLPLTYNKDMQEDKERYFRAVDEAQACLQLSAEMIATLRVRPEGLRAAVSDPLLLATDLADHLTRSGLPFREAHGVVAAIVRDHGARLHAALAGASFAATTRCWPRDAVADAATSVQARDVVGGTAPRQVAAPCARAKRDHSRRDGSPHRAVAPTSRRSKVAQPRLPCTRVGTSVVAPLRFLPLPVRDPGLRARAARARRRRGESALQIARAMASWPSAFGWMSVQAMRDGLSENQPVGSRPSWPLKTGARSTTHARSPNSAATAEIVVFRKRSARSVVPGAARAARERVEVGRHDDRGAGLGRQPRQGSLGGSRSKVGTVAAATLRSRQACPGSSSTCWRRTRRPGPGSRWRRPSASPAPAGSCGRPPSGRQHAALRCAGPRPVDQPDRAAAGVGKLLPEALRVADPSGRSVPDGTESPSARYSSSPAAPWAWRDEVTGRAARPAPASTGPGSERSVTSNRSNG